MGEDLTPCRRSLPRTGTRRHVPELPLVWRPGPSLGWRVDRPVKGLGDHHVGTAWQAGNRSLNEHGVS